MLPIAKFLPLLFLFALGAPAEESVRPGINAPYEKPNFGEWVERFEKEGREVYDKRREIVAATGVQPEMTVADVGAGTGLFTKLFAAETGSRGRVLAVDISPVFVENIQRIAKEQGLPQVEAILGTPTDTLLPAGSVDLVFTSDAYHHFEYPKAMLRSIGESLRPGGTLVVVDFERVPGKSADWILSHVRAGKGTVIKEIESAGFELVEEKPFLRDNYFLKFRRKG